MRVRFFPAVLAMALAAACSSSGDTTAVNVTPVTVVGYSVTIETAPPDSAPVGTSIPIAFTATEHESDGSSKPASGKAFEVTLPNSGGTVNGAASVALTTGTDGSVGITWVLGPLAGPQAVIGAVADSASVDVVVIATAGPAATLAVSQQPAPFAHSGLQLTPQPVVQLRDADGNLVAQAGVPVTASIGTGDGTVGGTVTVNSDSAGLASFPDLSVSGVAGAVTLSFTATLNGQAATTTSSTVTVGPWGTQASMPTPRSALAVGVANGILYAVGGMETDAPVTGTVEAYDPATNAWTTKAPMPTPRAYLAVGVVNGILYAVGGNSGGAGGLATVEAYDPATDSWTTRTPMPTARYALSVGVVNGILYAVGGSNGTTLGTVEAYDPATDSWTTKAPMPTLHYGPSVGVVNGILYAVGGFDLTGAVQAYDPATNSWTIKAPMPTPRAWLSVGVLNGLLYAVGGDQCTACVVGTVEAYDPAADAWTPATSMLTPREKLSVGVVNGILYAVGGSSGAAVAPVEAFAP